MGYISLLALFFLLAGFVLILWAKITGLNIKKLKKKNKIQSGKVVYSDLKKPAKALFSKRYQIAGKPDYVTVMRDKMIPVEFKTGKGQKIPDNYRFQVAAYCHLLEENYNVFIPYGVIVYNKEKSCQVPYNPEMRFQLEKTLESMREIIKKGRVERNHNDFLRCKNCSMSEYCQKRIK